MRDMNILDLFFSPTRYFLKLREKPIWLLPLILILISALLQSFVATRYVKFDEIITKMRERGMTEEQIERVKNFYQSPKALVLTSFSVIFTTFIALFLLSLLLNFALPLLGKEGIFLKTFSVVVNAGLVSALGNLLRSLLILIKKSPFVATNLSLILPQNLKKTFLFSLFSQLDIFLIYQFALIGLGLTLIYELKGKKGYYLPFSLYSLWVILIAFLSLRGR